MTLMSKLGGMVQSLTEKEDYGTKFRENGGGFWWVMITNGVLFDFIFGLIGSERRGLSEVLSRSYLSTGRSVTETDRSGGVSVSGQGNGQRTGDECERNPTPTDTR